MQKQGSSERQPEVVVSEYTKGPWKWSGNSLGTPNGCGDVIWIGTDHGETYLEISDANEKLIAAAPELAEALQTLVHLDETCQQNAAALVAARAALRKAGLAAA